MFFTSEETLSSFGFNIFEGNELQAWFVFALAKLNFNYPWQKELNVCNIFLSFGLVMLCFSPLKKPLVLLDLV
jgi:hypothetical protein